MLPLNPDGVIDARKTTQPKNHQPQLIKPDGSEHPDLSIVIYCFFHMLACFRGFIGIKRTAGLNKPKHYYSTFSKIH